MTQFTFPNNQKLPPHRFKRLLLSQISFPICFEFWFPEIEFRFRHSRERTFGIGMAMPKTAMYENYFLTAGKNQIGFTWKPLVVQPVSKTHTVNHSTNVQLGFRVLTLHPSHTLASFSNGERVHRKIEYLSMISSQEPLPHGRRPGIRFIIEPMWSMLCSTFSCCLSVLS